MPESFTDQMTRSRAPETLRVLNRDTGQAEPIAHQSYASMAAAPSPAEFGVGPLHIGGIDYWCDGTRYLGSGGTQGIKYIAPNATADDIIAVAAALSAAGGGIVQLPAVTITTDKTIPLYPGVIYQGCGYETYQNWEIASGTVIHASGSFPCFSANDSNLGVDDTAQDTVQRAGIRDLAMLGGTYGIKCGGTHKAGLMNGVFEHLHAQDQSLWHYWFENSSNCYFAGIRGFYSYAGGKTPCGMFYYGTSHTLATFNHGNSTFHNLFFQGFSTSQPNFMHGILFRAANGCALNDCHVYRAQVNSGNTAKVAVSGVAGDGVNTLTLPNGTNMLPFQVGFPLFVTVSAGLVGWVTAHQAYFVTSANGYQIQISTTVGGTPVTVPSTANGISLEAYGPSLIEVVGEGSTGVVQPSTFHGLDMEGTGASRAFIQNATLDINLCTCGYNQGTAGISSLIARISEGMASCLSAGTLDLDNNSAGRLAFKTFNLANNGEGYSNPLAYSGHPKGFIRDRNKGTVTVALGTHSSDAPSSLVPIAVSASGFIYPGSPIGQRLQSTNSTSLSMSGAHAGSTVYTGAGAATWTLPSLGNSAGGTAGAYQGAEFEIVNAGGGAITLNTQGSQLFNQIAAKTSLDIPAGASVVVRAHYNGSVGFWAVCGAFGTIT